MDIWSFTEGFIAGSIVTAVTYWFIVIRNMPDWEP